MNKLLDFINDSLITIPSKGIHHLQIGLLNEQFTITSNDSQDILIKGDQVDEKSYEVLLQAEKLIFNRNDHHTIRQEAYGDGQNITISLPKNILLKEFTFVVKSGEGSVSNIDADLVSISTVSGELRLFNIESTNLNVSTKSGDVELTNIKTSNISIDTTLADIEIQKISVRNAFKCTTIEGDIDVENGFTQELFFKTDSGDFDGKEFYPNTISYDAISGDLDIKNKKTDHDIIIKSKQSIEGEITLK